MISTQDLLVVLVIVLVLFGKTRLRELAKGLKEGVKNYKKSLSEPDEIDVTPKKNKNNKEGRSCRK